MQSKLAAFFILTRISFIQLLCINLLELGLQKATLSADLTYIAHINKSLYLPWLAV